MRLTSAKLLGVKERALVSMLQAPDKLRYRSFDIPKRSGGMRRIHAPGTELRVLQSRLFATIRDAYAPNASAHGFVPGRSIVSNASLHVGRRWVLNIDLRDFFPGISDIHVRDVFLGAPFSMGMEAEELAARICTRNDSLPQGAQTSPVLSNFVAAGLDAVLVRVAEEYGLIYSRYAEDITFSTDADAFPEPIAFLVRGEGGLRVAIAGSALEAAITSSGFTIHPGKVRLHHTSQRQVVTGLSVNTRVNPSRAHMRRLRAMIHAWKKFGLEGAANEYFSRCADKKGRKRQQHRTADFRSVVYGYMAFIKMVRGAEDPALVAFSRELIRIDQKALPRFVRHAVRSQNQNRRSDQDTAGVVEGADDESSQSG
jgi:RNA-directed DNA polymerase